jgi:hypothetical protein
VSAIWSDCEHFTFCIIFLICHFMLYIILDYYWLMLHINAYFSVAICFYLLVRKSPWFFIFIAISVFGTSIPYSSSISES